MNANELRIGNYVYDDSKHWVIQINSAHGLLNVESKPREYNNIPLTEEWILRAGFEKTKHSFYNFCYTKDDFDFDIVEHGNKWVLARYTNEDCTGCFYFAHGLFEYVHLFQNLMLSLTGEEIKFNQ